MLLRIVLVVVAILLLNAMWQCSSAVLKGRALSNAAVQRFHQQLNNEKYLEICNDADPQFIEQNRDTLVKILRAVHRKLGSEHDTVLIGIHVESKPKGTFTSTSYNTTFERGSATEKFTFVNNGGAFRLYGYHIDSQELITD